MRSIVICGIFQKDVRIGYVPIKFISKKQIPPPLVQPVHHRSLINYAPIGKMPTRVGVSRHLIFVFGLTASLRREKEQCFIPYLHKTEWNNPHR
jgi:hypothetical protein